MLSCKFCGPKLSLCGLILSVWGIIQLSLMGVFYYIQAPSMLEDLTVYKYGSDNFVSDVEAEFSETAYSCGVAVLLYVITLVVSAHQFWMNNRSTASM